jgi:hypothetical protein
MKKLTHKAMLEEIKAVLRHRASKAYEVRGSQNPQSVVIVKSRQQKNGGKQPTISGWSYSVSPEEETKIWSYSVSPGEETKITDAVCSRANLVLDLRDQEAPKVIDLGSRRAIFSLLDDGEHFFSDFTQSGFRRVEIQPVFEGAFAEWLKIETR